MGVPLEQRTCRLCGRKYFKTREPINRQGLFQTNRSRQLSPVQRGTHPLWLRNILKGLFMHIRRNFSSDADFQSQLIKKDSW